MPRHRRRNLLKRSQKARRPGDRTSRTSPARPSSLASLPRRILARLSVPVPADVVGRAREVLAPLTRPAKANEKLSALVVRLQRHVLPERRFALQLLHHHPTGPTRFGGLAGERQLHRYALRRTGREVLELERD